MLGIKDRPKISSLDDFRDVFWKRHPNCARCGRGNYHEGIEYTELSALNGAWINASPVCQRCWDELTPEGRFQWLLLIMAAWAAEYRVKPIDTEPPCFQARYRDFPLMLEEWRRALFEPPTGGSSRFGPNYVGYTHCYLDASKHELFPIPPLKLQICLSCHSWFDMDGSACLPWEV